MRRLSLCLTLWVAVLAAIPASATTILRDAEIERGLKELARPILQAAGVGENRIRILVIRDNSLNAFVVDSRHIFIHSGLIMRLDNPQALQAVIAHELAHIVNGHLTRRAANARIANRATAIGFALATAAALSGEREAAVGLAGGTANSARRVLFAHQRAEEASADQSALRYMARAGIDPSAMLEVFELFRGQEVLRPGRQDPYAITHPLTRDRLRAAKGAAAALGAGSGPSDRTRYWYARTVAKLKAYLENPRRMLRQRSAKGDGEIARLTRAVAYWQSPDLKKALAEIDGLIAIRPKDPFYNELRGQILLQARQTGPAIEAYKRAANLAPREALILSGLGQAYIAAETRSAAQSALKILQRAHDLDRGDPGMLRALALAHARLDQRGAASLATAERYAVLGRFADALLHATRAMDQLPRGSAGWLRAQDIEAVARRAGRK